MDRRRAYQLKLLILGLVVRLSVAGLSTQAGYMDTAFYTAGAVNIAQGGGLSHPFIWNYLNQPFGLPTPGFLYWMPLPSLLAAPAAALFPGSFFAVQVPFAILSALLPLVAYRLAWQATQQRGLAWAAGLLTLFSGLFFPYWTLPETFAPFALLGSVALWLAGGWKGEDGDWSRWLFAGVLVGLAHLTRADGILLLPIVALAPLLVVLVSGDTPGIAGIPLRQWLFILLGYLLVMAPWFARNTAVFGTPLSTAGTKTMWLTKYDDLFCYDCELSPSAYVAWGWGNILRSKLWALWINFQRFLAEDCLVFLLPFVVVGLYRLRRRVEFLLASVYLVTIYVAHSLIFTFPGWRGGFFHASAAVLPFVYAAGIEGLDAAVRWAAGRRRAWRYRQARTVFVAGAVVTAAALSGYMAWERMPAWNSADAFYEDVDRWLTDEGAPDVGVMVGNPPAFWLRTNRPAIVIPNGGVETLLEAGNRYGIRYVLLEKDHPAELGALHSGEERHPQLRILKSWAEEAAVLYAMEN